MSRELTDHLVASMPAIRRDHPDALAGNVLSVLLVLCDHGNADRHAWPALRTLEAETGLPVRTVRRSLEVLADAGLITADGTARAGLHGRPPTRWLLTLPGLPAIDRQPVDNKPDDGNMRGINAHQCAQNQEPKSEQVPARTYRGGCSRCGAGGLDINRDGSCRICGHEAVAPVVPIRPAAAKTSPNLEQHLGKLTRRHLEQCPPKGDPGAGLEAKVRADLLKVLADAATRWPRALLYQLDEYALTVRAQQHKPAINPGPSTALLLTLEAANYPPSDDPLMLELQALQKAVSGPPPADAMSSTA